VTAFSFHQRKNLVDIAEFALALSCSRALTSSRANTNTNINNNIIE